MTPAGFWGARAITPARDGERRLKISAPEIRALRIIKENGFVAPSDAFEEGRYRRFKRYILPRGTWGQTLGVNVGGPAAEKRAKAFFKKNPRRQVCVTGDPRRINAILKQVDA